MQIDAHQHYWNPARGDYFWMPPDHPILARPFGPRDLEPMLNRHGIARSVLVQAADTIHETEYMLGIADGADSVAGVVGWVDFERPEDRRHLERLARHPKFRGVRPMIQDIPDVDWMLRPDVQWGFEALVDLDLTFDALGFPRHLQNFRTVLMRYPQMRAVIDHCMKPQIRDGAFDVWAPGITRLARDTGAYLKLSGIVTEAAEDWQVADLKPYVDHVLAEFGPARIMWGSDWPVCTLASSYDRWREAALELTDHLTPAEKARVFGGTAEEFYRLS
ncbi:L-fuconolactone hydrolase [Candidatus Rhodobacter oscarellae]|uniref:L-fuconolactone hydrolase n=1 Tax=Candidatus Rhodobacter oscarellae TaxID=1675527 RepID=A0A0J9EE12_9RHOB|nr:amidohydrolase family protein [Candidatus Rhodobacter lobularis]KMW59969.1 L-fuconolactone hydrolase [Candidatus Rhodobacter lobularis]